MSSQTTSAASSQSLLALLQNDALHDTLIDTFLTLQSPSIPKTQTRLSNLFRDVKNDALKVGTPTEDACVVGEKVFDDDNAPQLAQFQQIIELLRRTQQEEARNQRRQRLKGVSQNDVQTMQWYTNLTNEANYWNLVGIQMHDTPLVQKSLALFKLRHQNLKHIRFVGKFFGLERNYFVIETDHDADDNLSQEELAVLAPASSASSNAKYRVRFGTTEQPAEQPGERSTTNHYRYWVCTSGESLTQSNWVRLPDVTPAQILTAKRIKKYLTGRLNAPVNSYPQFPGSEANYLRAQVARIVAATTIAPRGLYKLWTAPEADEDDEDAPKAPVVPPVSDLVLASAAEGEEEEGDEEGALNLKTLQKPENWEHLYPLILDVGRATEYKPPKVKTGDEDEEEEEEEDDTNKVPRLRALNADAGLQLPDYLKPLEKPKKSGDEEEEEEPEEEEEGEEGALKKGQFAAWSFQVFGELDEPSAVVLAQSLRWPGAFAFSTDNGKKAGTIYIGDGLKAEGDLNVFTPVIPEPIEQDASEPKQQEDPTVSNEKRVRDFGEEPLKEEGEEEGEGEEED